MRIFRFHGTGFAKFPIRNQAYVSNFFYGNGIRIAGAKYKRAARARHTPYMVVLKEIEAENATSPCGFGFPGNRRLGKFPPRRSDRVVATRSWTVRYQSQFAQEANAKAYDPIPPP